MKDLYDSIYAQQELMNKLNCKMAASQKTMNDIESKLAQLKKDMQECKKQDCTCK